MADKKDDDYYYGIPDFMNRTSTARREIRPTPLAQARTHSSSGSRSRPHLDEMEEDFRRSRDHSVGGEAIRARRSTRKVSKSWIQKLKEKATSRVTIAVVSGALGIVIGASVMGIGQDYAINSQIDNLPIVQEMSQIVGENVHRTNNGEGYFYDNYEIAKEAREKIENGASPTVVLGSIAERMNEGYAQDDLDSVVNSIFDVRVGADEFVRQINPERYQDGIHGENFMNDYHDALKAMAHGEKVEENDQQMRNVYDTNHNQELDEMISEYDNVYTTSQEKGMGGK